ncbi:hypothetical protein ABE438_02180 [Bosea sp. TWI1241]|uniref:hypothetical protein n=1 Tax=Bosea sp. TWI1241 TaxID=3148904 RepID=UPI00320998C0
MRLLLYIAFAAVLIAAIAPHDARRLLTKLWHAVPGQSRPSLPPRLAEPEPLRITIAGRTHLLRLDALQRFGATPREELCTESSDEGRANACGRVVAGFPPGDAALLQAAVVLEGAGKANPAERLARLRDANGLVLMGLRSGAFAGTPNLPAFAYGRVADQADNGRVHEIAAELAQASAGLCDEDDDDCRMVALQSAGRSLVAAGRWFNDARRLQAAAELLASTQATMRTPIAAADRFDLANDIGNAYSYASTFAAPEQRVPLIARAIAAYEAELPYAEAQAPSFDSGKLWQNLGAAYVDRGVLTGDRRDFERGLALYEKSLPLFDRTRNRSSWARSMSNMGAARGQLGLAAADLAIHEQGLREQRESIAAFEAGEERLDAAYGRYRLALGLSQMAQTADRLAGQVPAEEETRRAELSAVAARSRRDALAVLVEAAETFRRSGSRDYLARVERLTAEIRRSLPEE